MEVQFVESKNLKEKPTGALGFGKYYTDYMFVMDWDAGQEWHDARVVPYGPLEFDPASMVLHYAQETSSKNASRFNKNTRRTCKQRI